MKNSIITYEIVCSTIEELIKNNEKITVRNVLTRTGGRTSAITEHVKRWHEEQNLSVLSKESEISLELKRAVMLEKAGAVAKTAEAYKNQLSDLERLLTEATEALELKDQELSSRRLENEELKQQLAINAEKAKDLAYQLDKSQSRIAHLENEHAAQASELTKSLLNLEHSQNMLASLQTQLEQLQNQVIAMTTAMHQAEKSAAVWESKHEQLQAQLDALIAKLK